VLHISERKLIASVFQRRVDSYSSRSRGSANDTWTHDLFERNGDNRDRLAGNPLAARLGETYVVLRPSADADNPLG
jgi:hypothetical protein